MEFEGKTYYDGMTAEQLYVELGALIATGAGKARVELSARGNVGSCTRLTFSAADQHAKNRGDPDGFAWLSDIEG